MTDDFVSGWTVGSVTRQEGCEISECIGLTVIGGNSTIMDVNSAKHLVRQLLLLIDDAEKANGVVT